MCLFFPFIGNIRATEISFVWASREGRKTRISGMDAPKTIFAGDICSLALSGFGAVLCGWELWRALRRENSAQEAPQEAALGQLDRQQIGARRTSEKNQVQSRQRGKAENAGPKTERQQDAGEHHQQDRAKQREARFAAKGVPCRCFGLAAFSGLA
jgi:hypothetical protein